MDRCHLYLPLVDSAGALYPYAEVTLLDDTGAALDDPVYLDPTGGTAQAFPVLFTPAVISLWTDTPRRVTVQAQLPGGVTYTRTGVDLLPAPADVLRSQFQVRIASPEGTASSAALIITPGGTAIWQALDVLRYHEHDGNAPSSTVLGPLTPTDIYPAQTWVGSGITGAQGEGASALGSGAQPNGTWATALGAGSTAGTGALAAGSAALAADTATALGAGAQAPQAGQTVLGRAATAATAPPRAVVVGRGTAANASTSLKVGNSLVIDKGGHTTVGTGPAPDLAWLAGAPALTFLGSLVSPRFFAARKDITLAGTSSNLSFFGAPGSRQPILDIADVADDIPGRPALLSLMRALDRLGLIHLLDGAVDDELTDWAKTSAHGSTMTLETGDPDGSKAGDTSRARRTTTAPASVTYQRTGGLRDVRLRVFTQDPSPSALNAQVTAEASPNATTWTPVPLAWQPPTATAASWHQTWAANARPVPSGMQYLRITLNNSAAAASPQIGRAIVR